jgi:transposase
MIGPRVARSAAPSGKEMAADRPHQAVSAPAPPPGARVWLACGYTDMRKGMDGLAVLAQQVLKEDPFGGALFAFRGRRGSLIKLLWYEPQAWLTDVLERIVSGRTKSHQLDTLLPWNWDNAAQSRAISTT